MLLYHRYTLTNACILGVVTTHQLSADPPEELDVRERIILYLMFVHLVLHVLQHLIFWVLLTLVVYVLYQVLLRQISVISLLPSPRASTIQPKVQPKSQPCYPWKCPSRVP